MEWCFGVRGGSGVVMRVRKLLRIAACVLAIPAGGGLAGCTDDQTKEALIFFGSVAAMVLLGELLTHSHGTASENAVAISDVRLKTEIKPVAVMPNGLTLYSFRYRSDPAVTYVGVLAQDLLQNGNELFRHAVSVTPSGYYAVNYAELGLKMVTLDEWRSVSADVCRQPQSQCRSVALNDLRVAGAARTRPMN